MSSVIAYAFDCKQTLPEILAVLHEDTEYDWIERDSYYWGDYISANISPHVLAKIYGEGPWSGSKTTRRGYQIEVTCTDEAFQDTLEAAARELVDKVLPFLGAQNVRPATPMN